MIEKHLQNILRLSKSQKLKLYVVGGTLRDLILGRQSSDYDFAVSGASILAKQYAHDTKSVLVPLDTTPGRETFRVVIKKNVYFDFSELQGNTIESDLSQRDFSINALAVSLPNFIKGTKKYIDPHNGKTDIKSRIIRALPGPVFSNDPLRMLRAFRFMSILKFQIEENTFEIIKDLGEKINQAAPERIYNELNLLLNSKKTSPAINSMHDSGLLERIFPVIYKNQKTPPSIRVLDNLENILSVLKTTGIKPLADIKKVFSKKRGIIKLGAILYPLKKTMPADTRGYKKKWNRNSTLGRVLTDLRASNADIDYIGAMISCWRSASDSKLDFAGCSPNLYNLYQFINQHEKGLIPGLYLHLANRPKLPQADKWMTDADCITVRNTLDFYFHIYIPAKTRKPLLNGDDIQQVFKVTPNSSFKTLLDKIEEARVLGIIHTRSEAIHFAKGIFNSNEKENI